MWRDELGTVKVNGENEGNKKVKVKIVLDESGSMGAVINDTIGGFNTYINKLKEDGVDYEVSLTKFSNTASVIYVDKPIGDVEELNRDTYSPNGLTALLDAVGKTISESKGDGKTLLLILTDGEENFSQEYKLELIRDMIKEKEKAGWTIVYLGAGQDVWNQSSRMGIGVGNTASFKAATISGTLCAMAAATTAYAVSNYTATMDFYKDAGIDNKKDVV